MFCEAHEGHYTSHVNHFEKSHHLMIISVIQFPSVLHYIKNRGVGGGSGACSLKKIKIKFEVRDNWLVSIMYQTIFKIHIITEIKVSSKRNFTTVPVTLNVICLADKCSRSDTKPMSPFLSFWQEQCWRPACHLRTFLGSTTVRTSEKTPWSHTKILGRGLPQPEYHMRIVSAWNFSGGIKQQVFPFSGWHSS